MAGTYVDTTIVVAVAEELQPLASNARAHAARNKPAEVPAYALRELTAGVLATISAAHNRIASTSNPAEALQAVLALPPAAGRKREGQLKAIAEALAKALQTCSSHTQPAYVLAKREMCQYLLVKAQRYWIRAAANQPFAHVHPLACFLGGDLEVNDDGLLEGPGGTFNCEAGARCSAAAYLYDRRVDVEKLVEYLKKIEHAAEKRETSSRRKALQQLLTDGPVRFDRRRCRALGDAFFAVMCPPGSDVLTTNLSDHEPLCLVLKKKALRP